MKEDVAAMESGDVNDFKYANDFVYPAVKVDRVLRDGDQFRLGSVSFTARLTPGHTRGATTWVVNLVLDGRANRGLPRRCRFQPGLPGREETLRIRASRTTSGGRTISWRC